jgi:hypothetical protein
MPIKIHGKEYMTVAERVNDFRRDNPDYTLSTELVLADETYVVMKASILNTEGRLIATGYAEERRGSSMINKTSALENCETSAIGRALAAFGLGGTEYASANEVQNAIAQQDNRIDNTVEIREDYVNRAEAVYREELEKEIHAEEGDFKRMQQVEHYLTNDERIAVMNKFGSETVPGGRKMLKNLVKELLRKTEYVETGDRR